MKETHPTFPFTFIQRTTTTAAPFFPLQDSVLFIPVNSYISLILTSPSFSVCVCVFFLPPSLSLHLSGRGQPPDPSSGCERTGNVHATKGDIHKQAWDQI